jgi:hypothetical protein
MSRNEKHIINKNKNNSIREILKLIGSIEFELFLKNIINKNRKIKPISVERVTKINPNNPNSNA